MSSYDEHLITQAGGDGDPLDAIEARTNAAFPGPWKAWDRGIGYEIHTRHDEPLNWSHRETFGRQDAEFIANARTDVPTLLALVRTQQATIDRVLNLANSSGRCGWKISADELRKTLRGES